MEFAKVLFVRRAFVEILSVSSLILSHVITELSITLPEYLPFP